MTYQTVIIPADETTSDPVDLNTKLVDANLIYRVGQVVSIVFPETMTGEILTVQKFVNDEWRTLYAFGSPYTITVVDGVAMIEPAQAYLINGVVRFVSNATETAERTLLVEIIRLT
jgi:hypothetical protein